MFKESKLSYPRLFGLWIISLLTIPFGFLFSGMFINIVQTNLQEVYKYIPAIVATYLLYIVNPVLSLIYISLALLVGLFHTLFKSNFSLFKSGLMAVTLVSGIYLLFLYSFFYLNLLSWDGIYHSIQWSFHQLSTLGLMREEAVLKSADVKLLAYQVPSIIVSIAAISLFIALIFEKKLTKLLSLKEKLKGELSYFKVPDYFVWILILSLAFAFIDVGSIALKMMALNVLNICVLVYFIQGFAILFNFFEVFKVGFFTKFIMVLCLVIQLPFITAIFGVLDYWFNFRGRFLRKATQIKERSGL